MSLTFGFYQDEARHQPLDSLVLSGGACRQVWVGTNNGKTALPAVDSTIVVNAVAVAPLPETSIRLASSLSGLASGGQTLALGQVVSGMQPLWVQIDDAGLDDGEYQLTLQSNLIYEV